MEFFFYGACLVSWSASLACFLLWLHSSCCEDMSAVLIWCETYCNSLTASHSWAHFPWGTPGSNYLQTLQPS